MILQTVLADDEPLARLKLRQMLAEIQGWRVAGEGASAAEVLDLVRETTPQLLFLDICMPGVDGFALVDQLHALSGIPLPRIVFTTAYDTYALRAFDMNAVDYLLKPFTTDRLRTAVDRARDEIHNAPSKPPGQHDANQNGGRYTRRIVFKSRGRILFLPCVRYSTGSARRKITSASARRPRRTCFARR